MSAYGTTTCSRCGASFDDGHAHECRLQDAIETIDTLRAQLTSAQDKLAAIDRANRGADPCSWERLKDEAVRAGAESARYQRIAAHMRAENERLRELLEIAVEPICDAMESRRSDYGGLLDMIKSALAAGDGEK